MRQTEIIEHIESAREVTTPFGRMVVAFVECPTCGAKPGTRCRAITYDTMPRSNQVHRARRTRAVLTYLAVGHE